jgi:hypothetical protein
MTDTAVKSPKYPTEIVTYSFWLDDVVFAPISRNMESAQRDGVLLGHALLDDNRFWFARKFDAHGELSDWKPMRSAAEARAFLVSKIRQ